jgi:hypothetical protein
LPTKGIEEGQVRGDDLALFAVADGLLAKMAQQEPGRVTDDERQWMLDHAREALARVLGISLDVAGRELHSAAVTGHLTEQYSDTFAVVSLQGRILYCMARVALRGACHPERN